VVRRESSPDRVGLFVSKQEQATEGRCRVCWWPTAGKPPAAASTPLHHGQERAPPAATRMAAARVVRS
jgi:hypothetical protein